MDPRYFASPSQAVEAIDSLLRAGNWRELSRYYDLFSTSLNLLDLESGAFFGAGSSEGASHPAWPRGPHRPFPPGFRYESHETSGDDAVVTVSISIDEGGGMTQRGYARFRMRRSARGWQLRPEAVD